MTVRLPGVDLLRAGAIGAVMLYHASSHGISLPGFVEHGWMGVDLFFVLSGYLVGWKLLGELAQGCMPGWDDFLRDRALRILPAYGAVLALYLALPASREGGAMQPLWKFLTFTINLAPDWTRGTAFSHAWSLCVEGHFYLLLPLCAWLAAGRMRASAVVAIAAGLVLGGMALRGWLWHALVGPAVAAGDGGGAMRHYAGAIYMPTCARLDGLLAGVAVAATRAFRPAWWNRLLNHAWPLLAAGAALVVAGTGIAPAGAAGAIVLFPLLALGFSCLLVGAIGTGTPLGTVALPGVRMLATLAFSLYLMHKQVYAWLDDWLPGLAERSAWLALPVYGLASLAFATLLYVAVERPCLRLRARRPARSIAAKLRH
ncbi:acyltransferase [Massilia sp. METH4]|uniref:acyltransferase family protein n=1 Tax=Massilia sp. METH4 TaxID=3123041 RepID=UPI0030D0A69A